MLLLQILADLSWLLVPLLLLYLVARGHKAGPDKLYQQNAQRDQMWRDYLATFRAAVKTSKEKQLLDTLIQGNTAAEFMANPRQTAEAPPAYTPVMAAAAVPPAAVKLSKPIDNTILLLYFGAFLLVASVGLFVAIGGLGGLVRTIIVAVTASVLYFGGFWLQAANKKLAEAGISFVGTGMIIAPLTGVAWYNLVAHQAGGGLIWLLTSVACIGLYTYAFTRIKNDFIAYLLIGSFVSSIESAVLTVNLPAYGYAWGLIAAGMGLAVTGRLRGQSVAFNRAGNTSSQLLIPLSVLGSIALIPQFGSVQLAVTLSLSGAYYALLAWWQPQDRQAMGTAAQVSFISAAASLAYAIQQNPQSVGITLIIIAGLYGAAMLAVKPETLQQYRLIEIGAVANGLAVLLSLGAAWQLVAALGVAIALAAIVWQKLQSEEALQAMGLLLAGLPFVAGQYALHDRLGSWLQLSLCLGSAAALGILVALASRLASWKQYYATTSVLYILGSLSLLIPAGPLGFRTLITVTLALMASYLVLHRLSKDSSWLVSSAVITYVPLLYAVFGYGFDDWRFSAAVGMGLLWNIGVSLFTRQALVRWLAVIYILIAPIAIGSGGLGIHWAEAGYAGGYLLAMASCILARAIARGKLLLSSKVPIASYYREASQAYVAGYTLAGILAILVSLSDAHSQLITTLILGVIGLSIVVVAKVERTSQLLALLPIIMQGALFSGIRPDTNSAAAIGLTAVISALAAMGVYAAVSLSVSPDNLAAKSTRLASVATAYIGPALVLTQQHPSLLLPASLFMAGLLTFDYNRSARQDIKEFSLAVCIASVHWFVFLAGYTSIHIHTHLLAVSLAGFAYWRNLLGDTKASVSYVQALFFVVTIPLALQSLSGESGSLYGLLLIGEQACFMIAGVSFGQRFLLRWGLWTALAAVLFQLRGLGWAFLSLLALIIIATAVYRLQKHPPEN